MDRIILNDFFFFLHETTVKVRKFSFKVCFILHIITNLRAANIGVFHIHRPICHKKTQYRLFIDLKRLKFTRNYR